MTNPTKPPLDATSAALEVLAAEAAWNTQDPKRVAGASTIDEWRIFGPCPDGDTSGLERQ